MKEKSFTNPVKFLALALIFSFFGIYAGTTEVSADDEETVGKLSRLVTSNNPDNYAVIEVNGDDITARGRFTSDTPLNISFTDAKPTAVTFKNKGGGEFTAELTCKPLQKGYYKFYIGFKSKAIMSYLMAYDEGGWYIPDNNLSALNAAKLDKIRQTDPLAAAYYISPTGDKAEIKDTMEKIQAIADQVCEGIEDDYRKAYLLNRWIADNIYYDHDAADTEVTIETVALSNVLEKHRTTCAGYANLYCALLETRGIRSVNLKGTVVSDEITYDNLTTGVENHEFTAFWYEKQNRWIYTDSCWSGAGDYENGKYTDRITYDKYFDITGEAFSLNHRIDKAEERFYTKALAAVEASEATEILKTEATSADPTDTGTASSDNVTETEKTTDADKADTVPIGDDKPVTEKRDNDTSDKEKTTAVPYIIIGIVGAVAAAAGIILAVRRYKQ